MSPRRAAVMVFALTFGALTMRARAQRTPVLARLFPAGDAPLAPSATPAHTPGQDPASCGSCHVEIAREWNASLHRAAWTDPIFTTAFAIEPQAFCRNCHAPLTPVGARLPDARAAHEGISCTVCHVRDGMVLGEGARRTDRGVPAGIDVHPVRADPSFGTSAYCAGCHQFDFPTPPGGEHAPGVAGQPLQNTFAEWTMSPAATRGASCQDCHMPWRTTPAGLRYRSHSFPGVTDAALMSRAVHVEITALRDGEDVLVTAVLTGADIGHAFPTGDLFRRAEFRVWADGRAEARGEHETLTRWYGGVRAPHGRGLLRRETADTRVPSPGEGRRQVVNLHVQVPRGANVRWALDHVRAARGPTDREPDTDAVRTRVLEGTAIPVSVTAR